MFQNYNQKLILDRDQKASTKRKSNWKEGQQCGNISTHAISKNNREQIRTQLQHTISCDLMVATYQTRTNNFVKPLGKPSRKTIFLIISDLILHSECIAQFFTLFGDPVHYVLPKFIDRHQKWQEGHRIPNFEDLLLFLSLTV